MHKTCFIYYEVKAIFPPAWVVRVTYSYVPTKLNKSIKHSYHCTVGKRNYFTRKVTYFTMFIVCGQISVNIAIGPFPSDFYTQVMPIWKYISVCWHALHFITHDTLCVSCMTVTLGIMSCMLVRVGSMTYVLNSADWKNTL